MSLFTSPSTIMVGLAEVFPLAVDFTQYLSQGDALQSASVTLFNTTQVAAAILSTTPTISGNQVLINIKGSDLIGGQNFRLDVTVTVNASKILTASVGVDCPY